MSEMNIDQGDAQGFGARMQQYDGRLPSPGVDVVSETFSGSCSLGKRKSGRLADGFEFDNQRYFLDISKRGRSGSISQPEGLTTLRRSMSEPYATAQCSSSIYLACNKDDRGGGSSFAPPVQGLVSMAGNHPTQPEHEVERRQKNRRRRREKASLFSKPWEAYPFKGDQRNCSNNLYKRQKLESTS
jgi:hypothetical protein